MTKKARSVIQTVLVKKGLKYKKIFDEGVFPEVKSKIKNQKSKIQFKIQKFFTFVLPASP